MFKKSLALLLAFLMCLSLTPALAEETPAVAPEALTVSIDSDDVYTLSEYKLNNICFAATQKKLDYILIDFDSIPPTAGTLKYNSTKTETLKSTTKFYRDSSSSSAKLISKLEFYPNSRFSGEVVINYTAYTKKETDKPVESFDGTIVVTITESVNSGDIDLIKINAKKGGKYKFNIDDFDRAFNNAGIDMNYVTFTLPDSDDAELVYNYSATSTSNSYNKPVLETNEYYLNPKSGDLAFDKVTLVIEREAANQFDLNYTVVDEDDNEYFGIVTFELNSGEGYDTTYETNGESVVLRASDFNSECIEYTGYKLRSIKFSKPKSGTLWYDYDDEEDSKAQVSTTKSYYYDAEPYLYLISYVPKDDYKGVVYIDYEATSVSGDEYDGMITVNVNTKDVNEADDITFSVRNTSTKNLSASSFGSECMNLTDETLYYVKFTQPTKGKLYYDYDGSDEYAVSSSDKFYYRSSEGDYIGDVTYVPQKGHSGTVTISYTGMTEDETTFRGTIKISVTGTTNSSSSSSSSNYDDDDDYEDEVSDIKYSGTVGKEINFSKSDFYKVCSNYTGDKLDYVTFTTTSSSTGTLYYDYDGDDEEKLSSSDRCYYSGDTPLISDISFVPKKSGTIEIKYKAYPEDEDSYTGYVIINAKSSSTSSSSDDDDYDYEDDYEDDYSSNSSNNMKNFKKNKVYMNGLFTDVDENEWYGANSSGVIKNAYAYGLMQGNADGTFNPQGNMTIAEAITIAARISDIYYEDNAQFGPGTMFWYDDYVNYAIEYNIISQYQFSNYNIYIKRDEMAKIFANILPKEAMDEINSVSFIPDVSADNEYYSEILYLYKTGIVAGDEKGAYNPKSNITRAEVSAIISRIVDTNERLYK